MSSSTTTLYLCAIMLILLALLLRQRKKALAIKMVKRRKKERVRFNMSELLQKFIGKDCIIYVGMDDKQVTGIVKSIAEGWVEIESKDGNIQAISVDYISRIREYPLSKNGKKKSIVAD